MVAFCAIIVVFLIGCFGGFLLQYAQHSINSVYFLPTNNLLNACIAFAINLFCIFLCFVFFRMQFWVGLYFLIFLKAFALGSSISILVLIYKVSGLWIFGLSSLSSVVTLFLILWSAFCIVKQGRLPYTISTLVIISFAVSVLDLMIYALIY